MKPNLFRWATSELSQDAFLCWLIEWGKPHLNGKPLNKLATKFIKELSDLNETDINELEVRKQYKNIDIVVVINKKYAILIEDKVHSKNHSNQLQRYAEILKEKFSEKNLSLIYLKTGDQSNYKNVESKGYKTYKRDQLLKLLKEGQENGITNEIFNDFLKYLTNIDNSVNSFKTLQIDKWHRDNRDSWKGFYIELQKRLGQGDWAYVPQKNGGFLGFWWHRRYGNIENKEFEFYLQLEQHKLIFKLYAYRPNERNAVRNIYRRFLYQKADELGIPIKQYGRIGQWMGVAISIDEYRVTDEKGILDFNATLEKLKQSMNLLDEVEKEIKAHNNS